MSIDKEQTLEDLFYKELCRRLSTMRRGGPLYKLLKEHLQPLGYWKTKRRGKAFAKGKDNPGIVNLEKRRAALAEKKKAQAVAAETNKNTPDK